MSETITRQIELFREGSTLAPGEASSLLDAMISETDEQLLATLFLAWNDKGIDGDDIYAIASVMRDRCTRIETRHPIFVDVVGTGGSSRKTFNVSTAAAFVIAGAGVAVAKHGNRAATSNSGSADVLAALGIEPSVDAATASRCLDEIGICFMFAPNFHRLSPTLAKVRRGLGFPTIFNCVGPLCNPASAPHQLIGVWDETLVPKMADALSRLGTTRSWIVHGRDGLDEITLADRTHVAEVRDGEVRTFDISPDDFGLEISSVDSLRTDDANASADLVRSILDGSEDRVATDLVLMNAAAAIHLTGLGDNLVEAVSLARKSIESGAALEKMKELATETTR